MEKLKKVIRFILRAGNNFIRLLILGYCLLFILPRQCMLFAPSLGEPVETALKYTDEINLLFCGIGILFLLEKKYPVFRQVVKIGWLVIFISVPYLLMQVPSVQKIYHQSEVQHETR